MLKPPHVSRGASLMLAAALFLLDQGAKWLVAGSLRLGEVRSVIPGLFNLTHLQNRGAAFGLFADSDSPAVRAVLIAFSVAALLLVLFLLWRGVSSRWTGWGLGLILGGALGNDLRPVADYGTGALNDAGTGTVLVYPAGAAGDNFV